MPDGVAEIFGIAIYGMFLAIIIPKARDSHPVLEVVLIAAILSCVIYYVPFIHLSSGLSITLCAVVAAAYGAWKHPLPAGPDEEDEYIDSVSGQQRAKQPAEKAEEVHHA